MSNYAPRYAAICEKWPELRHPDVRFFGDNWSSTLVEYNDEMDGVVRYASSTPIFLAIIRAKLEDGLPDRFGVMKWGDGWVIAQDLDRKGVAWYECEDTAIDALLAWWEGRNG